MTYIFSVWWEWHSTSWACSLPSMPSTDSDSRYWHSIKAPMSSQKEIKVWWHDATLFFFLFVLYFHKFRPLHSYSTFIRSDSPRFLSISSSLVSSEGKPPYGAKPRIELGPALQQADALPSELRRTLLSYLRHTLSELRRTLVIYAAPERI